jgi:hypothetical protein
MFVLYIALIGGEGIAYHNIPKGEPKPELNHLRVAGITIDPMNKQNVGLNQWVIGWTGPGEWMSYKVLYKYHIITYTVAHIITVFLLQCTCLNTAKRCMRMTCIHDDIATQTHNTTRCAHTHASIHILVLYTR